MTVKNNVTIYKCEFCKKELKRKHAMVTHELRCSGNPINKRPCLYCQHLDRKEISYYSGVDDFFSGEPIYRNGKAFYCKAKDILILHPKTQYLNNRFNLVSVELDGEEVEQEEMPTYCETFKNIYLDMNVT